jgi:hypothetical protein
MKNVTVKRGYSGTLMNLVKPQNKKLRNKSLKRQHIEYVEPN